MEAGIKLFSLALSAGVMPFIGLVVAITILCVLHYYW